MKKTKLVFSLVREQSMFMTVVLSVLTFLSVLSLGIALAVGTSVIRWNNQWDKYATIQITDPDNTSYVKKIFEENANKFDNIQEISKSEMEHMLQPWISSGAKLNNYLPTMFEVKLKKSSDMTFIKEKIASRAKFLTHTSALKTSISAGWKLVSITTLILILMLVSIGVCVSYISRNIAMLHKHELEILNQVGATDNFIAKQMQIIVAKISSVACLVGFICAIPIILMILSTAHSARIGLMATLSLSASNWIILMLLPIIIILFSVYITKKTTFKILSEN
jgi:cell division transport system permease protein